MKTRKTILTALALTLPLAGAIAQCTNPPSGLVGWWSGDGHAYDLSPSHYHASLAGATYATGIAGQAFDCHGSGRDVVVGDAVGLHFTNNFSFAAWFKPAIAGTSIADPILGREGEYMMCILTNQHLGVILANTTPGWGTEYWRFVDSGYAVPTNEWTHAAVVYSNSVLQIYVNGSLRVNQVCTGNVGDYWVASNQFRIGGRQNNNWEYFYNGLVDEVVVFNRPLLADEVAAIYALDAAGMCKPANYLPSGLLSWWRGESDASDTMGAHPGTPVGDLAYGSGQCGQAFSLNGQNAAVALGDWFTNQQFTLSFWVRPNASQGQYADILDNVHSDYRSWAIQYDNVSDSTRSWWHWGTSLPSGGGSITFALTNGAWQHWVVTLGTNRVQHLYLNGALAGSTTNTAAVPYDGSQYFNLGRHQLYGRYFNGLVDELMVFDRALDPAEVTSLYVSQGGLPKLEIQPRFPDAVSVSWPASAEGFGLVSRSDVAPGNWEAVTNVPVLNGARKEVLLPVATPAQRFLRLSKPGP